MALEFWPSVGCGLGIVLAGSLLLEALLLPRPRLAGRPAAAWAVQGGICLLTYGLELVLFQRAWFGAAMALATLLLLVVVSNVKARLLREPFLFQDYEYFTDLLRHPRLYLPFFGVWKALAGLSAFGLLVYAGMAAETGLPVRGGWGRYLAALALLGGAGFGLLRWAANRPAPVLSFDPSADLRALGFLGYLWWYALAEREPVLPGNGPFSRNPSGLPASALADLVVVQSESFFDPRRLYPDLSAEATAAFDQIRAVSQRHGLLTVPAWGANTVRTEFAFLSGLGPQALGVHRFNPYRTLAGRGIATLASHLQGLGYRTVCVHPYGQAFYRRGQVYPALGFDAFIDIAAFSDSDRSGPYVGDVAVGRKVRDLLQNATQPMFVFAITMENHGPLHWESAMPADEARFYPTPPPKGYEDLTVYLRHLLNAGLMLRNIQSALAESPREGWLCWYGDHVPIMDAVYAGQGFADGRTDYFIWRKGGQAGGAALDLSAWELASALLVAMGLMPQAPLGIG